MYIFPSDLAILTNSYLIFAIKNRNFSQIYLTHYICKIICNSSTDIKGSSISLFYNFLAVFI